MGAGKSIILLRLWWEKYLDDIRLNKKNMIYIIMTDRIEIF